MKALLFETLLNIMLQKIVQSRKYICEIHTETEQSIKYQKENIHKIEKKFVFLGIQVYLKRAGIRSIEHEINALQHYWPTLYLRFARDTFNYVTEAQIHTLTKSGREKERGWDRVRNSRKLSLAAHDSCPKQYHCYIRVKIFYFRWYRSG